MGAITVTLSAVAAVASLLILRKVHRMSPELERLNASSDKLLAAVEKSQRETAAWIAELRNIVDNNTQDPDMKIQLSALADKMDQATSSTLAGLKSEDSNDDGQLDSLHPPAVAPPGNGDGGAPAPELDPVTGLPVAPSTAPSGFDPSAPAAPIDPATGQPVAGAAAAGDQLPGITGQAEGAGDADRANLPPRDEVSEPIGDAPPMETAVEEPPEPTGPGAKPKRL
jgi:hypothetical protein